MKLRRITLSARRLASCTTYAPKRLETSSRSGIASAPGYLHGYHSSRALQRAMTFPATFMRGGTSNGLLIAQKDLPSDVKHWRPILSSAMGSPDVYGRQLNGMGSGVSSTSKVCVVERSSRPGIDVDYTFVQVGIRDGALDMAGNCGNMSSAVGPFALNQGLVARDAPHESMDEFEVTVKMFNTNTNKTIHSTFTASLSGSPPAPTFSGHGNYSIDGVPGMGSRITLSFLDPEGAKTDHALPTGNAVDELHSRDGKTIRATLTDIANPGVFVLASDIGITGDIDPTALNTDAFAMANIEYIRRAGATAMGLDPNVESVPKLVMLSSPTLEQAQSGVNIVCRALSMQQAHRAVPLTLALNLGAACRMPGTLPAQIAVNVGDGDNVTIGHASGTLEVGSIFTNGKVESALLHRTARILMKGEVFYDVPS